MKSIKAIVYGSVFIAIAMLFLQLAYIFMAVGYISLESEFVFLKDISGVFRYSVAIPVFVVTFFLGGYLVAETADVASHAKVFLHCLAVWLITLGGMTYFSTDYMRLTASGIVIFVLALCGMVAGGFYRLKKQEPPVTDQRGQHP